MTFFKIGKPVDQAYLHLAEKFADRIKHFVPISVEVISERRGGPKTCQGVLERLNKMPGTHRIALDERGTLWTSPQLARFVDDLGQQPQVKNIVFIVGGPYGLSPEIQSSCHSLWSLAQGVYPSDLAWVMALEQIYRACTINRGMPYHHS